MGNREIEIKVADPTMALFSVPPSRNDYWIVQAIQELCQRSQSFTTLETVEIPYPDYQPKGCLTEMLETDYFGYVESRIRFLCQTAAGRHGQIQLSVKHCVGQAPLFIFTFVPHSHATP